MWVSQISVVSGLQWYLISPVSAPPVLPCAAQSWPGCPSHLFYSDWSCAVASENYDKSWSLLHYSAKFLHTVAFCHGEVSCLFVIKPLWLLQSIVQEVCCWIIGIRLLCELEVNCCVLYLSNNANWGNKHQDSDPGQGSHREDCSGRKICERWVPRPRQPSGHHSGLLWIKVLQLEQLLCFWQTKYLVLSCRKLIIDGHEVKLGVWDTAGSERYDTITRMYYRYEVI